MKKCLSNIKKSVVVFFTTLPNRIKSPFTKMRRKHQKFMKRRPHRSFKKTDKFTKNRSLKLPGYIAFSSSVWGLIWKNRGFYLKFFLMFCAFSVILLGVLDQETYSKFRDSLNTAEESGTTNYGFLKYFTLAASALTSSNNSTMSEGQTVIGVILFIFGWLILVWSLRRLISGQKIKFRDGLYNAGTPFVPTLFVVIIGILQLIPLAACFFIYQSLSGVGIINSGIAIENMAFWFVVAVVAALTLYWLVSTFIALIIVTLPGAYPGAALKAAGDVVVGRRLRILYRILYMIWPLLLLWALVLIPIVMLDNLIQIAWLPLVPFFVLILTTLSIIWVATYIYSLYRKVVADDAKPVK